MVGNSKRRGSRKSQAPRSRRGDSRPYDFLPSSGRVVFEQPPEGLGSFTPSHLTLEQIGGCFTSVFALILGVDLARSAPSPKLTDRRWGKMIHSAFQTALVYSAKCTEGLGVRLRATQLVPRPLAIEKRARELVDLLVNNDLATRASEPVGQRMILAAKELADLGISFRSVPKEADIHDLRLPPMTKKEAAVLNLLAEREPHLPITSEKLASELTRLHRPFTEASGIRTRIIPKFKKLGLETHGKRGYSFPADALARVRKALDPGADEMRMRGGP